MIIRRVLALLFFNGVVLSLLWLPFGLRSERQDGVWAETRYGVLGYYTVERHVGFRFVSGDPRGWHWPEPEERAEFNAGGMAVTIVLSAVVLGMSIVYLIRSIPVRHATGRVGVTPPYPA
jgi:hypothetical protein